jgi:hypothetical protein
VKITFERSFTLTCYEVLLTLRYKEKREDVKRFLQAFKDKALPNDGIAIKVAKYLKQLGLLQENEADLTTEGKRTLETGLFQAYEQGVYRVWITDRDKLLGTRILALNRVSIDNRYRNESSRNKSNKLEDLPSIDQAEQTLLLAEENPKTEQSHQVRPTPAWLLRDDFPKDDTDTEFLANYKGFYIKEERSPLYIKLEAAKGDEKTSVHLEGKLSLKIREKDTGCEADLSDLDSYLEPINTSFRDFIGIAFDYRMSATEFLPFQRWDEEELSLRVKFTDLRDEEQVRGIRPQMKFKVDDRFFGGEGEISAFDVPLLADDITEAIKWRDHMFVQFLADEYKLPDQCEHYLRKKQDVFPPIASFLHDEPLPNESELEEIVSNNPNAYWHYFAPIDLKP